MSIYTDNDYENRQDYLESLAYNNDVDLETVIALAEILGEEEDFDGLVTSIEDIAMGL